MTQTQENQTGYEDKTVEELFELHKETRQYHVRIMKSYNLGFVVLSSIFNKEAFLAKNNAMKAQHMNSIMELAKRVGIERQPGTSLASVAMDVAIHDAYKDMPQTKEMLKDIRRAQKVLVMRAAEVFSPKSMKDMMKKERQRGKALVQKLQ